MATIPTGLHIVGELHSDEDLLIEGRVEGHIHVPDAAVTIAGDADVKAQIRARQIYVHGTVRGGLAASDRIEIAASASVTASVSANHIVVAEGAELIGHVDMNRRTIAARVARQRAVPDLQEAATAPRV